MDKKHSASAHHAEAHSSARIYTQPELRERLKDDIMAGDRGGAPGQWSARKAQLLAQEYRQAGGGYTFAKRSHEQQHLQDWTTQDWQTADGHPAAGREGGTARYLPKQAWTDLTPAQRKATNAKKQAGSRAGEQHVPNTAAARNARKKATDE
ncbi:hypothetical protein LJ737_02395 [Hymenobacter sp. 15J16-1T3B]|uniref:hypothetical protein n=1 Tax=Hymenobacter sp. 15J16-1T3B TaxID=2886941 RepID=UPI001D1226BF|nr:hypothetical protein [Hymenobacter sp. 15J16-1T3B]MCC3156065.1 hypothetical protein [Hymenobacter sp. 15J16-1T3B]